MASHVLYLLPFPAFSSGHLSPSVAGPLPDAKLGSLVPCLHLPSFSICRSPSPGSFHFLLIAQVMLYDQVFGIWVLSPIDWSLPSILIENVALGISKIQQVEGTPKVEGFISFIAATPWIPKEQFSEYLSQEWCKWPCLSWSQQITFCFLHFRSCCSCPA